MVRFSAGVQICSLSRVSRPVMGPIHHFLQWVLGLCPSGCCGCCEKQKLRMSAASASLHAPTRQDGVLRENCGCTLSKFCRIHRLCFKSLNWKTSLEECSTAFLFEKLSRNFCPLLDPDFSSSCWAQPTIRPYM